MKSFVENIASFGCHCSSSAVSIKQSESFEKYLQIAKKTAIVGAVVLSCLAISGCLHMALLGAGIAGSLLAISVACLGSAYYHCRTAGVILNPSQLKELKLTPKLSRCNALPTQHCADTVEWRKKLISAANHNIVISGNYCGGKSFVEFLEAIRQRMIEKPDLKVLVLSSPLFLKGESKNMLALLKNEFPDRFSLVKTPDIWHLSPGLKKATNHTKCMLIDYGKYFILGGSGVKDNFAKTGLDDLSVEQFLEETEGHSSCVANEEENSEDGLTAKFIPGNFRDMDFVFSDNRGKHPCGQQIYKQMLLLAHRWEQYGNLIEKQPMSTQDPTKLGIFTRVASEKQPQDTLTMQLLKTPIPAWKTIRTQVPKFDRLSNKAEQVEFQLFASGPEQKKSVFAEKLKERIDRARTSIAINHMYFHPTDAIMDALIRAAKRGVKITIISNGVHPDCPRSHQAFGPRNKYNFSKLLRTLSESERANVELYEFKQHKKGNHKKAIVIDDFVIAGSSNLGYKSLVTTSDHELNFIARSKTFANETLKVFDIDKAHSHKLDSQSLCLSVSERIKAGIHRTLAPLIG